MKFLISSSYTAIVLSSLLLLTPILCFGSSEAKFEGDNPPQPSMAASAAHSAAIIPLYRSRIEECEDLLGILVKATFKVENSCIQDLTRLEQEVLLPLVERFDIFTHPLVSRESQMDTLVGEVVAKVNGNLKLLSQNPTLFSEQLLKDKQEKQWLPLARFISEIIYLERKRVDLKAAYKKGEKDALMRVFRCSFSASNLTLDPLDTPNGRDCSFPLDIMNTLYEKEEYKLPHLKGLFHVTALYLIELRRQAHSRLTRLGVLNETPPGLEEEMKKCPGAERVAKLKDLFSKPNLLKRLDGNYLHSLTYLQELDSYLIENKLRKEETLTLGKVLLEASLNPENSLDLTTINFLRELAAGLLASSTLEAIQANLPPEDLQEHLEAASQLVATHSSLCSCPSPLSMGQFINALVIGVGQSNTAKDEASRAGYLKFSSSLYSLLLSRFSHQSLERVSPEELPYFVKYSNNLFSLFTAYMRLFVSSPADSQSLMENSLKALKLFKRIEQLTDGTYMISGDTSHLFTLAEDVDLKPLHMLLLILNGYYDKAEELRTLAFPSEPVPQKRVIDRKAGKTAMIAEIKAAQAKMRTEEEKLKENKEKQVLENAVRLEQKMKAQAAAHFAGSSTAGYADSCASSNAEIAKEAKAAAQDVIKREQKKAAAKAAKERPSPESAASSAAAAIPSLPEVDTTQEEFIEIDSDNFLTFERLMIHERGQFTRTDIRNLLSAFGGIWDNSRGAGSHSMVSFRNPAAAEASSSVPALDAHAPQFDSVTLGRRQYDLATWVLPSHNELPDYLLVQLRNIFRDAGLDLTTVRSN